MVNKSILIVHSLFLLTSCIFFVGEEYELTFEKEPFRGSNLKLDGYFYSVEETPSNPIRVLFLYNDGSILYMGTFSRGFIERTLVDSMLISNLGKTDWGLFNVRGDSLNYEIRYPSGFEHIPFIHKGIITSDTTFEIREWMRYDGTEREPHHVYYRFKKFHPKPDSTNELIK